MVSSEGSLGIPKERSGGAVPRTWLGGRAYRSTGDKLVLQLVVICFVFALIVPFLIITNPGAPAIKRQNAEIPRLPKDWLPSPPWIPVIDVKSYMLLAEQNCTISGDVLVRPGAELDIVGCNVTMCGTFYVEGRLDLSNSSIRPMPEEYGYSVDIASSPSITVNLTGCRRAMFDFELQSQLGEPVWLDVVLNGTRTGKVWNPERAGPGDWNASVDLSPFCGAVCELDFCSTFQRIPSSGLYFYTPMYLIRPQMVTDRFTTGSRDLIVDKPVVESGNGLYPRTFPHVYRIQSFRGQLTFDNCTVTNPGGYGDILDANGTTVLVSGTAFAQPDGENTYGNLDIVSCNARITGSSFDGDQIQFASSSADISGSSFSNAFKAIEASNTFLSVSNCRFSNCTYCIGASADLAGGKGSATIRDSIFNATEEAVRLDDIASSVEGCTIRAPIPIVVSPRASFTRANCTLEAVANLTGNSIDAIPGHADGLMFILGGEDMPTAVVFVSAIPVSGLERLVLHNELNGTRLAARYLPFDLSDRSPSSRSSEDKLLFNSTGTARELGSAVQLLGKHDFSDGWQNAIESEFSSPFDWGQAISDWRLMVPADRLEKNGTGYTLRQLPESGIQVKVKTDYVGGSVEVDARNSQNPRQVPRVGSLRSHPDLSVSDLRLSYAPDLSLVDFTVTVSETAATDFTSSRIVCKLDGRTLEDFITPVLPGESTPVSVYLANMSSGGELTLSIVPTNGRDADLTNNEAHTRLHMVNESTTLDGDVDLGGLWLLGPDVNLTFENCTGHSTGDVSMTGMGNNQLDIISSVFNITSLGLKVDSGRARDSEILANYSGWGKGLNYPFSLLSIGRGTWVFGNTTFGLSASDFARLEPVFLSGDNANPPPFRELYMELSGEALSCDDCSFLAPSFGSFSFNSSIVIRNCTCPLEGELWFSTQNVTFENNRFGYSGISLAASGKLVVDGNSLWNAYLDAINVDNGSGIEMMNNDFRGATPGYDHVGVEIDSGLNVSIVNNSFSDMATGVLVSGPSLLPEYVDHNSFSNISFARAYSYSSVTLQVNIWNLSLMLNRQVTGVHLSWNDSGFSGSDDVSIQQGIQAGAVYLGIPHLFIRPDGTLKEFQSLTIHVDVRSVSGIVYSYDYTLPFNGRDSWTENIG